MELCERSLTKIVFRDYPPSEIGAAALLLALKVISAEDSKTGMVVDPFWDSEIEKITSIRFPLIEESLNLLQICFTTLSD